MYLLNQEMNFKRGAGFASLKELDRLKSGRVRCQR
jgi:hypothetical protein